MEGTVKSLFEVLACTLFSFALKFLLGGGKHIEIEGAALYLLVRQTWRTCVEPGKDIVSQINRNRLRFNLQASNIKLPRVFPFVFSGFFFVAIFVGVLLAGLGPTSLQLASDFKAKFEPRYVTLKLSYPSYQGKKPESFAFELGQKSKDPVSEIVIEGSSVLEMSLTGPLKKEPVLYSFRTGLANDLQKKDNDSQIPLGAAKELVPTQPVIISKEFLQNQFTALDFTQSQSFTLALRTQGERVFMEIPIVFNPIASPQVELKSTAAQPSDGDVPAGSVLAFSVKVTGAVPLSLVELQARTKSGYRFSRAVGEFANSEQTEFENNNVQLPLIGVPFTPNDSLFVKAVAKTLVPGLEGESAELEFKVKTKQDIRQEIVERLTAAMESLEKMSPTDLEDSKSKIEKNLEAAATLAPQMGQRHPLVRRIPEAQKIASKITSKGDTAWQNTKRKIAAALELLKKEQQNESTPQLLARLQNFKQSIEKSELTKEALLKMSEELKADVNSAKSELKKMAESGDIGLTPKERQSVQELLQKDTTSENLTEASDELKKDHREKATANASEATESASKNLGQALQVLQAARARDMDEARKKLTEADAQLQDAKKQNGEGANGRKKIAEAGESLAKSPRISKEFNEALAKAKQGQSDAQGKAQKGDKEGTQRSIEQSQDGIVQALEALQDEQSSEQESKREGEGRQARSAMDYLSAQGQVDVGWRKTILDEMTRLKAAGEPANSSLLQYLESRLR
jgi:hypothetical protein